MSVFNKKWVVWNSNNGFTFVWNNLLSCWNVVLNQNDKYNFLKINSDVSRSNDYISKKVWINWLSLINTNDWEILPREWNKDIYDYVDSLFSLQTWDFWKKQVFTNTNISWENFFQPVRNVADWWKIKRFEPIDTRAIFKNDWPMWGIESFTIINRNWQSQELTRDEVWFYLYNEDPVNPWNWYWVVDWIIFDILADREAWRTNYYTFENNWVPWAIFTLSEWIKDPDQIKKAQDLITKKFNWSANSNKILASPHITDVKVLNLSNKDMEYLWGRQYSSTKIASAFGLHPKLIGYEGKTWSYSEIVEIRKEIHSTTIKWFERYLSNIMNTLIDKFSNELLFDLSQFDIQLNSETFDDEQAIFKSQREDYKLWFFTANQILKSRNLPESEDKDYWESRYIATNLNKVWAVQVEDNSEDEE